MTSFRAISSHSSLKTITFAGLLVLGSACNDNASARVIEEVANDNSVVAANDNAGAAATEGNVFAHYEVVKMSKSKPTGPTQYASEDKVETVSVAIDGSDLVRGRSTVMVNAPIEKVRETVLGFNSYPEFMPHYSKCKVLGNDHGVRDVMMEVTAIHGLVKMWARLQVEKPTAADGVETIDTKFLQGNVKDLKATYRLKKIDAAKTQLSIEVFLNPNIALPHKSINSENLSGSAEAVLALKQRSEGVQTNGATAAK